MKLEFVGVGHAFTPKSAELYHSNILVEAESGKKLLIDCGSNIHWSLEDKGIHGGNLLSEIDAYYVSHLHADHIGGLEQTALATFFGPGGRFHDPFGNRPKLFCIDVLMDELWESLKGGLRTLQGFNEADLDTFFEVHKVRKNNLFEWEGYQFRPVQTVHVVSGTMFMDSFGLLIQKSDKTGKTIFFTSDTQFAPHQLLTFYDIADIILQDCETSPFKSGVHAHYNDLKGLSEDVKSKMHLYHYQPNPEKTFDAEADGFGGFIKRRDVFEI